MRGDLKARVERLEREAPPSAYRPWIIVDLVDTNGYRLPEAERERRIAEATERHGQRVRLMKVNCPACATPTEGKTR